MTNNQSGFEPENNSPPFAGPGVYVLGAPSHRRLRWEMADHPPPPKRLKKSACGHGARTMKVCIVGGGSFGTVIARVVALLWLVSTSLKGPAEDIFVRIRAGSRSVRAWRDFSADGPTERAAQQEPGRAKR